jgi:uncharacterized protein
MEIQYYPNAVEFLSNVGIFLARDEARYGLISGLSTVLEKNPHSYGQEDPWFCSIGAETGLCAVAMRTPPHKAILAYFSGDKQIITKKLVTAVAKSSKAVPGVLGDKELTDIFASLWCKKYKTKIIHTQAQRIYRLDKVNDVPLAPGKFRQATITDKELVVKWMRAFSIETGGRTRNTPEKDITPVLEHGWVFFWEDEKPVSMAIKVRPTEKGMTVSGVYTPPEMRYKGYATSCVAELSRNILQSGKEFCTLYTDLANPTSNSIYNKIGYKPVCDSVEYTFDDP